MMTARDFWAGIAAAGLIGGAIGTPAGADVKAGADAWSRGDYPAAVAQWQGPSASGDPDAQFNLGQAYRLGRGVERDLRRAEELFGRAAAAGHLQAADNYGLLMFDRGARAEAMPYIRAAAERGDPRAQYLLGIAHFNGDLAPKDWVRAYALLTLAQSAGLPQAGPAISQMDSYIPLDQRQKSAVVAQQLAEAATSARAVQVAAADLAVGKTTPSPSASPSASPPAPAAPAASMPGFTTALARSASAADAGGAATAGADYARPIAAAPPLPPPPAATTPAPPALRPPLARAAPVRPAAAVVPSRPAAAPRPVAAGPWRIQLGAFGVAANADALWARVSGRRELAGHARIDLPAGKVRKLQAGGFATREAAASACAALARTGITCLPVQD